MQRRTLEELTSIEEPAWPEVHAWIDDCPTSCRLLPPNLSRRGDTLVGVQNSLRTPLGAVIWNTSGLVIDQGWIRLLGSGGDEMGRDPVSWANQLGWQPDPTLPPRILPIANDVLGGVFALNWGGINETHEIGQAFYFAPASLRWEPMQLGAGQLIWFLLSDRLQLFYEDMRWPGWQQEIADIAMDDGVSVYPFLWAVEGGAIGNRDRRVVPIAELTPMHFESARQFGDRPS